MYPHDPDGRGVHPPAVPQPGTRPADAPSAGRVTAPRLVFWETTQACNLACVHCRRLSDSTRAAPDQLSTEEGLRLIDQVAQAGCMILVMSGGEPLMRADLFDLLIHARDRQLAVAVASNGTLINSTIARELGTCGVRRVSISLDGPDAPSHDSFRRIDGAFDAALGGIDNLKQAGIAVQINTTVAAHNHTCLHEMYDLAVRLGAEALHLFMLVPVGCGLELAESMMLGPQRYEEILNWVYDKDAAGGTLRIKATCAPHYMRVWLRRRKAAGLPTQRGDGHMYRMSRGCLAGTEIAFISHRGEVFPCGYLPVPAGNLREQSFRQIWEGADVLKAFREPVSLRGKCGTCEYLHVCLGCRARAYARTGDILAEEPCCSHQPNKGKDSNE
jgi:radical SAM protein with 4Fe4S-binding SPASM domain